MPDLNSLGLAPADLETLRKILDRVIPDVEVRAYGSRVRGTAKKFSDLDLVLMSKSGVSSENMEMLRGLFSLSNLSIFVDVSDWHNLPTSIRDEIETNSIVVQSMENKDTEVYIYHYTTIRVLSEIIKSKKVRMTRLDLQEDMYEGVTSEYKDDTARSIYVSSWMTEKEENAALWKIYGDDFRGVRIGLPRLPFLINVDENAVGKSEIVVPILDNQGNKTRGFCTTRLLGPDDIIYSEKALNQSLIEQDDENGEIKISDNCGLLKMPYYRVESECRFRLMVMPENVELNETGHHIFERRYLKDSKRFPRYMDIRINDEIFSRMQVLYGARCDEGIRGKIMAVINDNNPSIDQKLSAVKVRS